ncbi:MAG: hypothetical protein ABJH05_05985 [Fulvivirga sp.]
MARYFSLYILILLTACNQNKSTEGNKVVKENLPTNEPINLFGVNTLNIPLNNFQFVDRLEDCPSLPDRIPDKNCQRINYSNIPDLYKEVLANINYLEISMFNDTIMNLTLNSLYSYDGKKSDLSESEFVKDKVVSMYIEKYGKSYSKINVLNDRIKIKWKTSEYDVYLEFYVFGGQKINTYTEMNGSNPITIYEDTSHERITIEYSSRYLDTKRVNEDVRKREENNRILDSTRKVNVQKI